jgi:hypothetical protein
VSDFTGFFDTDLNAIHWWVSEDLGNITRSHLQFNAPKAIR